MKKFKTTSKIIICLLLVSILLLGFIIVSRKNNQAIIDEELLSYKNHPKLNEISKLSPKNIGGIKKKYIGEYMRGFHHIPHDIQHKGVVITFGGSEGSMYEHMANYLSSDGYEVVSVYYFGQKGQSEHDQSIPIEIYEEIYSYIIENCSNTDIITVLGVSKGAKLALLMSTYYDTIDNVVLFAPSSHVLGATNLNEVSEWTYNGEELEYLNGTTVVAMLKGLINLVLNKPYDQLTLMNTKFKKSTNLEDARIKVEKSSAKILIFYGEDDRMTDAKSASRIIEGYAKNQVIIHGYENVGHAFGTPRIINIDTYINLLNGGDLDSNIEADLDSKRVLLETLERWHK